MVPNAVPSEAPLAFALEPARPNSSVGTMPAVRLALTRSEAAWLWLFDVAGRRIARWEVGSLGVGRHSVDLAEGRRLEPGSSRRARVPGRWYAGVPRDPARRSLSRELGRVRQALTVLASAGFAATCPDAQRARS